MFSTWHAFLQQLGGYIPDFDRKFAVITQTYLVKSTHILYEVFNNFQLHFKHVSRVVGLFLSITSVISINDGKTRNLPLLIFDSTTGV